MSDTIVFGPSQVAAGSGTVAADAFAAAINAIRRATSRNSLANAPTKVVTGDQAWFWTPEWQQGEREADEDLAAGRLVRFESVDDMDRALDAAAKRYADPNL